MLFRALLLLLALHAAGVRADNGDWDPDTQRGQSQIALLSAFGAIVVGVGCCYCFCKKTKERSEQGTSSSFETMQLVYRSS